VLGILLLHADQVVSSDRLVDELWGERAPATAANAVQVYVSQLRKLLQPGGSRASATGALLTRGRGYQLAVSEAAYDLRTFEARWNEGRDHLHAGDPERAAPILESALALWRGEPLADFRYESFARAEIARLEEIRMAALTDRIECDLALGRHIAAAAELAPLVERHVLHERLRGQLMIALYRSGRQTEALDVFREGRRVLDEEFGLEPGPELTRLHTAILRHDPSLRRSAAGEDGAVATRRRSVGVVVGPAVEPLVPLIGPVAKAPGRELILTRVLDAAPPASAHERLQAATRALEQQTAAMREEGAAVRLAVFTSRSPHADIARFATEQDLDLLLVDAMAMADSLADRAIIELLEVTPCDVGLVVGHSAAAVEAEAAPVLVCFGGSDHDWSALQLGAWIARATGAPLRVAGAAGDRQGGRDASRLVASASLVVQRAFFVVPEPALVLPDVAAIVAAADQSRLTLLGLSPRWRREGLGETRTAIAGATHGPTIFVRRGIRPSAWAPIDAATRFTWSGTGG
jgi:DNA-binding SARP family transcriptional activator